MDRGASASNEGFRGRERLSERFAAGSCCASVLMLCSISAGPNDYRHIRIAAGSVNIDPLPLIYSRKLKETARMEWIIVIVLIVLLLGSVGPRAGYYGTASPVFDVLSLLILIGLVLFVLDLFGIIEIFGVGA